MESQVFDQQFKGNLNDYLIILLQKLNRTEQENLKLFELCEKMPYFRNLFSLKNEDERTQQEQKRKLAQEMRQEFFEQGEVILKEGDSSNEKLYFIIKGQVAVVKGIQNVGPKQQTKRDSINGSQTKKLKFQEIVSLYGQKVNELKDGDGFGEKIHIENEQKLYKRDATIIAQSNIYLGVLMKQNFMSFLDFFQGKLKSKKQAIRNHIPTLNEFQRQNFIDQVAHFFKEFGVNKKQVLIEQNKKGEFIYLVGKGKYLVYQKIEYQDPVTGSIKKYKVRLFEGFENSFIILGDEILLKEQALNENSSQNIYKNNSNYLYTIEFQTEGIVYQIDKKNFLQQFENRILRDIQKLCEMRIQDRTKKIDFIKELKEQPKFIWKNQLKLNNSNNESIEELEKFSKLMVQNSLNKQKENFTLEKKITNNPENNVFEDVFQNNNSFNKFQRASSLNNLQNEFPSILNNQSKLLTNQNNLTIISQKIQQTNKLIKEVGGDFLSEIFEIETPKTAQKQLNSKNNSILNIQQINQNDTKNQNSSIYQNQNNLNSNQNTLNKFQIQQQILSNKRQSFGEIFETRQFLQNIKKREFLQQKVLENATGNLGLISQEDFPPITKIYYKKYQNQNKLSNEQKQKRSFSLHNIKNKIETQNAEQESKWLKKQSNYLKWNQQSLMKAQQFNSLKVSPKNKDQQNQFNPISQQTNKKKIFENSNLNFLISEKILTNKPSNSQFSTQKSVLYNETSNNQNKPNLQRDYFYETTETDQTQKRFDPQKYIKWKNEQRKKLHKQPDPNLTNEESIYIITNSYNKNNNQHQQLYSLKDSPNQNSMQPVFLCQEAQIIKLEDIRQDSNSNKLLGFIE